MAERRKKTLKRMRAELAALEIGGGAASILPVLVLVIVRHEEYFTPATGLKMGFGAMAACVFALLLALGKVKISRSIWTFTVIFALSWLLEAVLRDLVLISGLALIGEIIYLVGFSWVIPRKKREIERAENREDMREAVHGAEE